VHKKLSSMEDFEVFHSVTDNRHVFIRLMTISCNSYLKLEISEYLGRKLSQ